MARWTEEERNTISKTKEEISQIFKKNGVSIGMAFDIIYWFKAVMQRESEAFLDKEKYENVCKKTDLRK